MGKEAKDASSDLEDLSDSFDDISDATGEGADAVEEFKPHYYRTHLETFLINIIIHPNCRKPRYVDASLSYLV